MITTEELIQQVRDQVDEDNIADLSDERVLRVLNRARMKLVRMAGRKFVPAFQNEVTVGPDTDDPRNVTIPELTFALTINEVNIIQGGVAYRVEAVAQRDVTNFESENSGSAIPLYYTQQGNKLKLYPKPAANVQIRIRYQFRPPELVKTQARITNIDQNNNLIYVDSLGSGLTTSVDSLGAFVNLTDQFDGRVKATLQVVDIDEDAQTLTFKTTGLDRSKVYGLTVGTAIPDEISQDDYVTLAAGTNVPTLLQDYYDYLVVFSVLEIKRSLGLPTQEEYAASKEIESDVLAMWAGKQSTRRIQKDNPYWGQRTPMIYKYR